MNVSLNLHQNNAGAWNPLVSIFCPQSNLSYLLFSRARDKFSSSQETELPQLQAERFFFFADGLSSYYSSISSIATSLLKFNTESKVKPSTIFGMNRTKRSVFSIPMLVTLIRSMTWSRKVNCHHFCFVFQFPLTRDNIS